MASWGSCKCAQINRPWYILCRFQSATPYISLHQMTQITPIKGFTNTPVTKALCIFSTLSALLILILLLKPYVVLAVNPYLVEFSQYWRVATFQLAVRNESDYMLIILLFFHFKTLERFFGSRKFLSLVTVFALYNAVLIFLILTVGQLLVIAVYALMKWVVWRLQLEVVYFDTIFNTVSSGPMGILSLLYMCYGHYIPTSYHFKILLRKPNEDNSAEDEGDAPSGTTLTLTDHFQVHAIYTILMLNNGLASFLPCLVGLIIGRLYTQDLLAGSKNWSVPPFVFRVFVNPRKFHLTLFRSLRRVRGYQSVSQVVEDLPQSETSPEVSVQPEEEESEEAIDDINQRNPQERSATPARPLGRQFLDIFRA